MSDSGHRKCVACGGSLHAGYIEDKADVREVLRWVPGPIERGPLGGLRVMGKQHIEIQAYACGSCGRLELYVPVLQAQGSDVPIGLPLPADG